VISDVTAGLLLPPLGVESGGQSTLSVSVAALLYTNQSPKHGCVHCVATCESGRVFNFCSSY
jgi:hypothetical protein